VLDDPLTLPTDDLARLAGTEVAVIRGTTLAASSSDLAIDPLRILQATTGRLRGAGPPIAYRVTDLTAGERLVVLDAPLEDSRKGTLFWLAGLFGLLATGVLIFASLAVASTNALSLREAVTAWTFVSPSLVLLLIFTAAPLLFALYLSFHSWNLLEPAKPFVAFQHYIDLAGDSLFWNAAKNTAVYSIYVPVTMALALGIAMLLNRRIKGVAVLRAIFFLPYITSFVAISIVWQWMYNPDFGLLNWALGLVGLGPFPWLNSPTTALLALILMAVWIHIGFQMVIFLAGLQAIPNELYEAATIDGAGLWRKFWRITLPLLRPTTFFVLVTSIIGSFQVFTFVYVMTEGGPLHATDVIVYHIYQNAWQFLRMGYASAMSWVLFAVIFLITLLQFRLLGRKIAPS
jgi:ABC-type sugar transport system permease subunit